MSGQTVVMSSSSMVPTPAAENLWQLSSNNFNTNRYPTATIAPTINPNMLQQFPYFNENHPLGHHHHHQAQYNSIEIKNVSSGFKLKKKKNS